MAIKKKQKSKKNSNSGFLEAAKIAAELSKKRRVKRISERKVSDREIYSNKKAKPITSAAIMERTPYDPAPKTNSLKGRNLEIIAKRANYDGEFTGFDDFVQEFSNSKVNGLDNKNGWVMEMVGGVAMIVILIVVLVLVTVIFLMFFLK